MKIKLAIQIEKLHRYVFDKIYVQNKKNTFKDKLILIIYYFLYRIYPSFRKKLYNEIEKLKIKNKLFNKKYLRYKYYEN